MLYAIKEGKKSRAVPGESGICPVCETEMIAKCGDINIWHWAHKNRSDCDDWHEPETDWHREWKSMFPSDWVEIIINDGTFLHRADVLLLDGRIIEFQHSYISPDEIQKREFFYKNMIWVFDIAECGDRFDLRSKNMETYYTFRWRHPRKHIAYVRSPCYLDLGYQIFQLKKIYLGENCGGWGYIWPHNLEFLGDLSLFNTNQLNAPSETYYKRGG